MSNDKNVGGGSIDFSMSENTNKKNRLCQGHEICFSVESTVQLLDIPEEVISTLLCYQELSGDRIIKVLSRAYCKCKVLSYSGNKALKVAAQSCPPLALAIALEIKRSGISKNFTTIEFDVVDIASAIGWDSGLVKYQLKQLEWTKVDGKSKRTAISVQFFDIGFRVRAPGDMTDEELDKSLDMLHERVVNQEQSELKQLRTIFRTLTSIAFNTIRPVLKNDCPTAPSEKLKEIIRDYFENDLKEIVETLPYDSDTSDEEIISDIKCIIQRYPENSFTGRAIARIFHGISSPNYPAVIWGRCKHWRMHLKTDFNRILKLANTEIVRAKLI